MEEEQQSSPLGKLLRDLRNKHHLSLRQVERATDKAVSNVYLAQLEGGTRNDPNPRVLVALARIYGVSPTRLFEAAGYIESPQTTAVEAAYQQVLADPSYSFGTSFQGELDLDSKRVIVQLYEQATRKRLLLEEAPGDGED